MKSRLIRVGIFLVLFLACIAGIVKWSGQEISLGTGSGQSDLGGLAELMYPAGQSVPLDEKFQVLEELGFSFTEEETAQFQDWPEAGYADLLAVKGWGEFDPETWAWSPTSDQVYALDTEVFDVGNMYPVFFQGLLSISGGELPITDVVQDDSQVEWESGTGTYRVTLNYDGRPYSFEAVAESDWLDVGILGQVNQMLKQEGVEKRFYAAWNSLQGITVFYCDGAWADQFERATGCRLYTSL